MTDRAVKQVGEPLSPSLLYNLIPDSLKQDPDFDKLNRLFCAMVDDMKSSVEQIGIYNRIDELPEDLLDILAEDFMIDWWDPSYTVEEKRRTFKDAWYVWRHIGTRAAVERALSAVYPTAEVLEWFEYGGDPYHFKVRIDISNDNLQSERMNRILERMEYYKSFRSHSEGVQYITNLDALPEGFASVHHMGTRMELHNDTHVKDLQVPVYHVDGGLSINHKAIMVEMHTNLHSDADAPVYSVRTGWKVGMPSVCMTLYA